MNHSVTKILSSLLTQILLVSWVFPYPTAMASSIGRSDSYIKQRTLISDDSMPVYQTMQLLTRLDRIWTRVKKLEDISQFGVLKPSTQRAINKYLAGPLKETHLLIVEGGLLVQTQEISLLVSDLKTITPDPIHLKSGAYLHTFADVTGDTTIKKAMRNLIHSDPIRSRVSSLYDTGSGVLGNEAKGDLDSTHIDERIAITLRSESPLGPILVIPSVLSAGMNFLINNMGSVDVINEEVKLVEQMIYLLRASVPVKRYASDDGYVIPPEFSDWFSRLDENQQTAYVNNVVITAATMYETKGFFPGSRNEDFIEFLEQDTEALLGGVKEMHKQLQGPRLIIPAKKTGGSKVHLKVAVKKKRLKTLLKHERFHVGLAMGFDTKELLQMQKNVSGRLTNDSATESFLSLWTPAYSEKSHNSIAHEFWTQLYFPSGLFLLKYNWLYRKFINFNRWIIVRVARLKVERILESTEEGRGFLKEILEIQKLAKKEGKKDFVALDKSPLNVELGLAYGNGVSKGADSTDIQGGGRWNGIISAIKDHWAWFRFVRSISKELRPVIEDKEFQDTYKRFQKAKSPGGLDRLFNQLDFLGGIRMRRSRNSTDITLVKSSIDTFKVLIWYKEMLIMRCDSGYYSTVDDRHIPSVGSFRVREEIKDKSSFYKITLAKGMFQYFLNSGYKKVHVAVESDESEFWERLGIGPYVSREKPNLRSVVPTKKIIAILNNLGEEGHSTSELFPLSTSDSPYLVKVKNPLENTNIWKIIPGDELNTLDLLNNEDFPQHSVIMLWGDRGGMWAIERIAPEYIRVWNSGGGPEFKEMIQGPIRKLITNNTYVFSIKDSLKTLPFPGDIMDLQELMQIRRIDRDYLYNEFKVNDQAVKFSIKDDVITLATYNQSQVYRGVGYDEMIVIGRGTPTDVTILGNERKARHVFSIAEKGVSRVHAAVIRNVSGWFLIDLASQNGTYVEDKRLVPGGNSKDQWYRLPEGHTGDGVRKGRGNDEMLIEDYSDLGAWRLSDLSDDQLYTLVGRTGKEEAVWDIKRLSELQNEDMGRVVKAGNMGGDSRISHVYEHFGFSPELNSLFRNAFVQRAMRIMQEVRKKRPTPETIPEVDSEGSPQEPQKGIGRITTRIPVKNNNGQTDSQPKRKHTGNRMAEDEQLVVQNTEAGNRGVVVAYFGGDLNLPREEGFTHILLIPKDQGETMWLSSYVAQVSYEDWVLKDGTSVVDLNSLSRNTQDILGIQISSLIKTPSISEHTPRTGATIVVIDLLSSLKAIGHIVDRMNIRDMDLQKKFKEMVRELALDLAA